MHIGPFGPGGYELMLSFVTPKITFIASLAPLSWGILCVVVRGNVHDAALLQIGPLKFTVHASLWNTDA